MQLSTFQQRGSVPFPAFTGERIYMREFTKAAGLPPELRRWQETVDAMLEGVDASGPVFLMVDQAPVLAATTQRRPGVHVDGYWHPALQAHGSGGGGGHLGTPAPKPTGGHTHERGGHRGSPPVTNDPRGPGRHGGQPSTHLHSGNGAEGLILASDVLGCAAYVGGFEGTALGGGDCAHIDVSGLLRVDMEPGRVWAGHTLTMLHEALPVRHDCLRTVVRLNVQGWQP